MQSYETHANGGRPFRVDVHPQTASGNIPVDVKCLEPVVATLGARELSLHYDCARVFIGRDTYVAADESAPHPGNTILLHLGDSQYIYVGETIKYLDLGGDIIGGYMSPIGNNDVPYPFAVSATHIYLLLDNVRVPICELDQIAQQDPYAVYYDMHLRLTASYSKYGITPRMIIEEHGEPIRTYGEYEQIHIRYLERHCGWSDSIRKTHDKFEAYVATIIAGYKYHLNCRKSDDRKFTLDWWEDH